LISNKSWIALLGFASGLSAFGMASVIPALPALGAAMQAEFSSVQFVVSAYLLGLGLAQPVQGMLCDRYGRRPVLLTGFTVFAIASCAATFATSLPLLIAARFLQALGVSVATVVARAMVRDTHDPERGAVALAFITAVMGVAPILGPIAGGIVVAAWGWRAVFVMHALIAALLLGGMAWLLVETRPAHLRAMSLPQILRATQQLLGDRVFLGYTMVYGFANGGSFAFLTVGAVLFEQLFQLNPAQFGLLWAVLAVAYTIGAAAAGFLARRFGSAAVLRGGAALTLTSGLLFLAAALWHTPYLPAFMGALILFTVGSGLASPLALAGAVSNRPELAGVASGTSSSLAMLTCMAFAAVSGIIFSGSATSSGVLVAGAGALAWVAARVALTRT